MVGNKQGSFIQLPQNIDNNLELRRFLDKLVLQLDIAFGHRGDSAFVSNSIIENNTLKLQRLVEELFQENLTFSKLDGSRDYTNKISYNDDKTFTSGSNEIPDIKYVEAFAEPAITKNTAFNKNFGTASGTVTEGGTTTNNPKQDSIDKLNQAISDPPTQAEVQAISDKIDTLIDTLKNANII